MKPGKVVLMVLFLLMASANLVLAEGLVVQPLSLNVTLLEGQEYTQDISVFNNYSFVLYNLTLLSPNNEIIKPGTVIQVMPNTSAQISVKFKSMQPVALQQNTDIVFLNKLSRTLSSNIIQVNITPSGVFDPERVVARQGDVIKWVNNDDLLHSVTSSLFDVQLQPGAEYQYTAAMQGVLNVHDSYTYVSSSALVTNNTVDEYVYYSGYNVPINVNFRVLYTQTDLLLELFESNLTCPVDLGCETVARVTNLGNATARNITFAGVTSSRQGFDLAQNNAVLAIFRIVPLVSNTSQTNASLLHTISVTGANFPRTTRDISLWVPHFDFNFEAINETIGDWWTRKLLFCRTFPQSPFCIAEPIVKYQNITVYRSPEVPYNYTQDEIKQFFDRLTAIDTKISALDSKMNDVSTAENNTRSAYLTVSSELSSYKEKYAEYNNEARSLRRTLVVSLISVLAIIVIGVLLFLYNKESQGVKLFAWLK